jgi:hypothetical protein
MTTPTLGRPCPAPGTGPGRKATRRGERGMVLMWVGLFLFLILAFISLGVDLAKLAGARTQLQNAADAAALAGASAVDFSTGVIDPDTAVVRAQLEGVANKTYVGAPEPVEIAAGDIEVIDGDKVRVTARREGDQSIVTQFATVLGIDALQMKAAATAKIEPAGSVDCGLVPIAVAPPAGETFATGCSPGCVLKVGGGSGSNGNLNAVEFPTCPTPGPCEGMPTTGVNTFRCLVAQGYCCGISVGDVLSTEPGNMSSFRKAVQDRFENDTDRREGICYGEYHGNHQRVILVPATTDPGDGAGRHPVTVRGFTAFFIEEVPGNGINVELHGEFVYDVVPGTGGGDSSGAVAYTIRLIE